MNQSKIEWTEKTWNPVTGCTKYSSGCLNCYAEMMAKRLHAMGIKKYYREFAVTQHEDCLEEPLYWKGHYNVFVCSMGDLFHEEVQFSFIDRVMETIKKTKHNHYQLLTKRAERMAEYFSNHSIPQNVWLGVTVENKMAKSRIDILRNLKSSIRFLSCEPLLEDLEEIDLTNIDWVIVGGESGHNARPMKEEWVLSIQNQSVKSEVAFFFKQWGTWGNDGVKRNKKRNGKLLCGKVQADKPILIKKSCIKINSKCEFLKVFSVKNIYGTRFLLFEIATLKKGVVYMSGNFVTDTFIIVLDVAKIKSSSDFMSQLDSFDCFLHPENEPEWMRIKFLSCLDGFEKGKMNPVPISKISYNDNRGVGFIDGITRLSYLVGLDAYVIPVSCDKESVEKLYELYGNKNFEPKSIQEYMNNIPLQNLSNINSTGL